MKYALIVGIENYQNDKAKFAINDASAIYEYFYNIVNCDLVIPIFDSLASPSYIISIYKWIVSILEPNDDFYLYFAGHGYVVDNNPVIVACDSSAASDNNTKPYITIKSLMEIIQQTIFNYALFIIDSCHASILSQWDINNKYLQAEMFIADYSNDKNIDNFTDFSWKSNQLGILCSCDKNGIAKNIEKYKHGLFTYTFLKELERNHSKDKYEVDVQELAKRIKEKIKLYEIKYFKKNEKLMSLGACSTMYKHQKPESRFVVATNISIPTINLTNIDCVHFPYLKNILSPEGKNIKKDYAISLKSNMVSYFHLIPINKRIPLLRTQLNMLVENSEFSRAISLLDWVKNAIGEGYLKKLSNTIFKIFIQKKVNEFLAKERKKIDISIKHLSNNIKFNKINLSQDIYSNNTNTLTSDCSTNEKLDSLFKQKEKILKFKQIDDLSRPMYIYRDAIRYYMNSAEFRNDPDKKINTIFPAFPPPDDFALANSSGSDIIKTYTQIIEYCFTVDDQEIIIKEIVQDIVARLCKGGNFDFALNTVYKIEEIVGNYEYLSKIIEETEELKNEFIRYIRMGNEGIQYNNNQLRKYSYEKLCEIAPESLEVKKIRKKELINL